MHHDNMSATYHPSPAGAAALQQKYYGLLDLHTHQANQANTDCRGARDRVTIRVDILVGIRIIQTLIENT